MADSYRVLRGAEVLGESRLEHADRSMGVVHGPFVAGAGYPAVQHVFRRFSQAQGADSEGHAAADYYAARDALGLRPVDAGGTAVETVFIHITDMTAEGLDELYVEVLVSDASFWKRYQA